MADFALNLGIFVARTIEKKESITRQVVELKIYLIKMYIQNFGDIFSKSVVCFHLKILINMR